ncbi:tetratricopeptide repeat protein [Lentzea sp. NPDC042327]|uniref:ATP-binding protein n=1 Tax=Lentzea sp. NPDC042327 TaxID=3154801 RepID=UPI0033F7588F
MTRLDLLRSALAARPGQPVPFDELVVTVWPDDRPANPKAALRNLVRRLRATEAVVTEPHGYRLVVRRPGPRQLPADLPDFVGRAPQIAAALAATAPVLAITGPPGVGKTSLAVHVAHRLRAGFPDGQLHVNLRAFSASEPVTVEQALARFLRALGAEQVPLAPDAQLALYRELTAGLRLLVVVDNATADLVTPLLPAGAGSRVIVTSRTDLPEHEQIRLDVFDDAEADALLTNMRVDGASPDRAELVGWCAHLPLALRIAAAHLTDRHLADYLVDLRGEGRLDALEIEGDAAVRATFELSYLALPDRAQRLFRLLGQVPGPDFGVEAATALLGSPAAEPLDQLVAANLVQRAQDRHSLHDLLRAYALRLGDASPTRLFAYYLLNADRAGRTLNPELHRLPLPELPADLPAHDLGTMADALAWLDTERQNVVAAVLAAADRPVAWQLTDAMRAHFLHHSADVVDWRTSARAGLRAARTLGDQRAEATMHGSLGLAHWRSGEFAEALPQYTRAVALARSHGDHAALSSLLTNLGIIHWELGHLAEAVAAMEESLTLDRSPNALYNLSSILVDLGPLDLAVAYGEEALEISRASGLTAGVAYCLQGLASVYLFPGDLETSERYLAEVATLTTPELGPHFPSRSRETHAFLRLEQGRYAEAERDARAAVDLAVAGADDTNEADGRITLGMALQRQGRVEEALAEHEQALAIARKAGFARGEVQALAGLAADHRAAGDLASALRCATEADDRAERAQLRVRQVQVVAELVEVHRELGDFEEAERQRLRGLELARVTGRRSWERRLTQPVDPRGSGDDAGQPPANGGSTSS